MELNKTIKICSEKGEEKTFNLLFKFDYGENNDQYIVYTDSDENSDIVNIICSKYKSYENGLCTVEKVEDEKVLSLVDEYMENCKKGRQIYEEQSNY